jgi:hypothetical protein
MLAMVLNQAASRSRRPFVPGRAGNPALFVSAAAGRTLHAAPVATRQPRRSLAVDNIVIYGETTARLR